MVRAGHIHVLVTVCTCAVMISLCVPATAQDARDLALGITAVEPPRRPAQFRNIDELNKYLAELRQYYTILGRPRFGRSTDRLLSKLTAHRKSQHNTQRRH